MESDIPPDIYAELMEARNEWSRHDYPTTPRAMAAIDLALDKLIEYHQNLDEYERVFDNDIS